MILVCANTIVFAQTNFVKNQSFEKYDTCPYEVGQLKFVRYWQNAVVPDFKRGLEYFNSCATTEYVAGLPNNGSFYQYPHSGDGMVGIQLFYDKTLPSPDSLNEREYLNGRLLKQLVSGKTYCVSFWINMTEASGYAHNKIGAYLDDGSINTLALDKTGEITSVTPQLYATSVIADTANWTKIEGSFIATGNENHISIGNFSPNSAISKVVTNYWFLYKQYSYYLIDDVSIIPVDLAADAGKDSHAELGKKVQIGRVGDTTAQGLDCKWYKKGVLIDSGAIISVNAGSSVGAVDTYVVVQTICGLVKTDTVTVKTVPLDLTPTLSKGEGVSVWPNPSNGSLTITPHAVILTKEGSLHAKVYDMLGRFIFNEQLNFTNNEAAIKLNAADGVYILELMDGEGNASRQRIEIRN
jgi:hypothetical protein